MVVVEQGRIAGKGERKRMGFQGMTREELMAKENNGQMVDESQPTNLPVHSFARCTCFLDSLCCPTW